MLLRKSKMLLCYALIIILMSSMSLSISHAESKPIVNSILGQVKIGTKSTMSVRNVLMIPSSDKQTLVFTIEITNSESKAISFYDYWINVKLTNGAVIPVKLANNNKNKNEVAPKTTAQYTFIGNVNRTTKYTDIIINLIKWDFGAANFTRVLKSVKLSTSYTPANNQKTVVVDGTKVGTTFKDFRTYKLEEEQRIEFNMEYTNWGYNAVTLPKYKYYFITPDQYVYEIIPVKSEDVKIQPKAKVSLQMKMNIPNAVKVSIGNIAIVYNDEQAKFEVPLNTFQVKLNSTSTTVDTVSIGTEKNFTIDENKYAVRLDSVQKLPLEDENIVASTITIINKSTTVIPIPDIVGDIYFDGVVVAEDKVKKTVLDGGVGIPINGSVRVAIHTKTPYNYDYSAIKLELNNQIKTDSSESFKDKIVSYAIPKESFTAITKVSINKDVEISTAGNTTAYMIHSLETYEGINTYLYNVLVEVQNMDLRASTLNKLAAYLKTQNNSYFPLKISEVKDKVSPSGKVLLSLSAKIPAYSNTNDLKLVLGEMVDENTYLSAVEFELPITSQTNSTGNLKNLAIYPYNLNINTITVNLDSNANVLFQYELLKTVEYESIPEGHSIIMELVDRKTEDSYSKEFKFETDLQMGLHQQTMVAAMNIDNPEVKITQMDGLTVNIYDSYEGHKKLLGSRTVYSIFIK